jgi:MFS family permease
VRENATVTGGERVTYRSVLANREFSALLLGDAISGLGDQAARVALAVFVFQRTHSPLAASATYAVTFLAILVAGPIVSTLGDRQPRRTVMVWSHGIRAVLMAGLAVPHPPLLLVFSGLALIAAITPAFESAQSATLPDVLKGEEYAVGQALMNIAFQASQVLGFVAGGALLAALSVRQVLLIDAATFLGAAGLILGLVRERPPEAPTGAAASILRDTREGLDVVLGDVTLRRLLLFALLGAATVSVPEGLAVPISAELGGSSLSVGILTASIPAGFVLASAFVLRLAPEKRLEAMPTLAALGAVPLLLTPFVGSVAGMSALWVISGLGSSLQLVASTAFGQAVPAHARARAFGLAGSALMAVQGVAQLLAGLLANLTQPRWTVSGFVLVIVCGAMAGRSLSGHNAQTPQEDHETIRQGVR